MFSCCSLKAVGFSSTPAASNIIDSVDVRHQQQQQQQQQQEEADEDERKTKRATCLVNCQLAQSGDDPHEKRNFSKHQKLERHDSFPIPLWIT